MLNQFNAPLWGDESFSAILSMHSLPDIIKIIINDTSPPLWNIAEWFVFNTLGPKEIYIRGLAFFFILVAVFFTYKIGEFLWDKKTALLAATLTFLNPFFFTYAFEGRMYSIMSAGVAGSFYFFSKILFNEGKVQKKYILGYVIMTLWALYSHHFAFFAVFAQGVWFLYLVVTRNKAAKSLFFGFLGVGLGYLPWLWPLYNQVKMVGSGFWLGRPSLLDLIALMFEYLAFGIKHLFAFPALVLVITTLLTRIWKRDLKKSIFIASWFLIPILASFLISQIFQPIFFNRYLLYTIPATMILVASNTRLLGKIAIAVILILFVVIDFYYFTHPTRPRFDQLVNYVRETKTEGDYLINWNTTPHFLWESKFYGIPAPLYLQSREGLPFFVGTALMKSEDLIYEIPKGAKRIGIITGGAIDEIKLTGYTEKERQMFDGLRFAWYLKTK